MSPLNRPTRKAGISMAKAIASGAATYVPKTLASIEELIKGVVLPEELEEYLNAPLRLVNRRQLEYVDIARIAYVHARSISEHADGASPVDRIIEYAKKNGIAYDKMHVKFATQLLEMIGFMVKTSEHDRGSKQSRCYKMPATVSSAIGIKQMPTVSSAIGNKNK